MGHAIARCTDEGLPQYRAGEKCDALSSDHYLVLTDAVAGHASLPIPALALPSGYHFIRRPGRDLWMMIGGGSARM